MDVPSPSSIHPINTLSGKRYINLVRCSTDGQTETSIPAQLELLNGFAASKGMVHVHDVILDGISGSKPGNREDLGEILDRKRKQDDFDVLLVQTEDRLTRGGAGHGNWIKYELERAGIRVVFASSDVPEGPYADILQTLKFQAAQETVKSTSLRSTQGYQRALENRHVATSTHTPYGCHRLYCSSDDKPRFLIRDNGDGTQHKLHPETRGVLETYGEVGGKAKGHYRKQKSEKVYLVMGEAAEVEVVRLIFRRKYLEGMGGRRIAKELNGNGMPAPEGGVWTQRQVDCIAENEVYTGMGVANRSASGRYYQRAKGNPQKVELDAKVLANAKHLPLRLRPPEEWVYQEQLHLKAFLEEPLRSIAATKIKELWESRCRPGREKRPYNAHPDSDYLLTGLLTAVQDGRKLKGYTSGPKGRKVRYYVHPLAQKDPALAGFPNLLFRADALEKAVLDAVVETLMAMPMLVKEVEAAVAVVLAEKEPPTEGEIAQLKQQKEAISKKIMAILDVIDAAEPEAKVKIAELKRQQRQIEERLREMAVVTTKGTADAATLVESVVRRLRGLGESIGGMPTYPLRQVLATLVESMTADMQTREVRIALRLPEMSLADAETPIETLSLRQTSPSSTLSRDQQEASLAFARIICTFERQQRQAPCFKCRRNAA
jgi:hypothetical protein